MPEMLVADECRLAPDPATQFSEQPAHCVVHLKRPLRDS
jgi:hypothetical protein